MNIRFLVLIPFFLGGCTNFFMAPQAIPSFSGSEDIFSGVVTSPVTGSGMDFSSGAIVSGEVPRENTLSGLTETGEKLPESSGSLCFHGICISPKHPYFKDGNNLVQISGTHVNSDMIEYLSKNPGKDENGDYKISFESDTVTIVSQKSGRAERKTGEIMGGSRETLFSIGKSLIVRITQAAGCAYSYKEEFFDTKGNQIADPSSLLPSYPKDIQVENMHLISDWTRASEHNMFGFKFSEREDPEDLGEVSLRSNYQETIKKKILEKSGNGAYRTYVIKFREIPDVIFYYTNSLGSSEAVIQLSFAPSDLDAEGNVISETKTREILKLYGGDGVEERKIWRSIRLGHQSDDYIGLSEGSFLPEMIPVFRVQKFDSTSYFLYPAKNYEGFTSAELCKPLVYVYDREYRANSLKVDFAHGGNFTRILPAFTLGKSWDFRADMSGNITVKNLPNTFGYLYYSARVPDYQYNSYGWQLYGRDIRAFFDEKLDVIGFNAQEKKDFIEYWTSEFDADTLYFVSFKFDEALDQYVTLDFSEKPKRQMRVLLEAYPMSVVNPKYFWPKVGTKFDTFLLKKFIRSGEFDVFEWGGMVQKVPNGEIHIY